MEQNADVLVIGAGAARLAAANSPWRTRIRASSGPTDAELSFTQRRKRRKGDPGALASSFAPLRETFFVS
jgi:hypothetical protein